MRVLQEVYSTLSFYVGMLVFSTHIVREEVKMVEIEYKFTLRIKSRGKIFGEKVLMMLLWTGRGRSCKNSGFADRNWRKYLFSFQLCIEKN